MECPACKYDTTGVANTYTDADKITRRRQCPRCGFRIVTEETIKPKKRKKDVYYDIR